MNKVAGKVRAETKVIYDLYAALSEDGAAFCVKKTLYNVRGLILR